MTSSPTEGGIGHVKSYSAMNKGPLRRPEPRRVLLWEKSIAERQRDPLHHHHRSYRSALRLRDLLVVRQNEQLCRCLFLIDNRRNRLNLNELVGITENCHA